MLPAIARAFALGFFAIVAQVVLLREFLVVVSGNELFLGLFFSAWFTGIFFGAPLGGRLADRTARLEAWCGGGMILQVVLLPALLVSLRALRLNLDVPPGELVPFGTLAPALMAHLLPYGFLIVIVSDLFSI